MIRIQFSSVTQLYLILCNPMDCFMPGFPVRHQLLELLKLMFVKSVIPSNHLILCTPLLFLPSVFPGIRVFSSESVLCIRWPKYWSFSFSISPSSEYSEWISLRNDWFDLLAGQGTLLQHHSSKVSILWCSLFFKNADLRHSLFLIVEKAMASHSSTLAWKIPWAEEPGGL